MIKKIGILVMMVMVLVGCHEEVSVPAGLELSLCMPANDFHSSRQRVMGDPGQTEHFALPRYAYIFVTRQNGQNYTIWQHTVLELDENNWEYTRYSGSLASDGDSIYRYKQPIQYLLQNDEPNGNIYAICSDYELTFNEADLSNLTTQEQILNFKIDVSADSVQQRHLQNIYTTPYNYTIGEKYYCAYDCSQGKVVHVNMMLYHIAAKVDLKWNVADTVRIKSGHPEQAVRLTYLEARRLFKGETYAFRPMENVVNALPDTGYRIPDIVTENDEGLWWEGRTYFYTIPISYTVEGNSYFPLQLLMKTNGSSGEGYRLTINQPIDVSSSFVPWLRGNIVLTKPLDDDVDVSRTIEN